MIKHIVMWKLKEFAEGCTAAENAIKIKEKLMSCAQLAPGTQAFEVALATPGLEATYDVVLYSVFENKAALEAYISHPTHQAIIPFITARRDGRQCMDYEI